MFPRKLTRQVICDIDNPIVETKAGKLRGVIVEGSYIFRGIKYADSERFKMPTPVKPWEGVKDAIMYGPVSMEMSTPIAHDAYNVPHFYFPQDENCQYLNVWTQSINDETKKKPVMVWIHGGGFATGSSVELYAYDGEELSKFGDVVVVSLNHRLNCIGFLDLSDYGEEYKYSGNVGMADVIEALRWIRENIAKFGGDPDNVTIMGQSGGGCKVAALLQMPAADGLFHKAVVQSGIVEQTLDVSPEQAKKFTSKMLEYLNITAENIKEIEKVPYFKLARAAQYAQGEITGNPNSRVSWAPVVDKDYYMGYGVTNGFREETKKIPMLVGTVLAEFTNNFNIEFEKSHKNEWSAEKKMGLMKEVYGDRAEAILAAFRKAYPKRNDVDALYVDTTMRRPSKVYAQERAKSGCAPVYLWSFNLECPLNGGTAPWHNAEEAYMFHNACYLEASYIPGVSEYLQDVMTGAWVAFAYTGDPNHPGMPIWPAVTPDAIPTILFDREVEVVFNHDDELMAAMPPANAVNTTNRGPRKRSDGILGGGPRQGT